MNLARTKMVAARTADQLAARFAEQPFAVVDVSVAEGGEPVANIVSPQLLATLVQGYDAAMLLLQSPDLPRLREECQKYKVMAMAYLAELERIKGKDYKISPECWKAVRGSTLFDDLAAPATLTMREEPEPQVLFAGEGLPPPLE